MTSGKKRLRVASRDRIFLAFAFGALFFMGVIALLGRERQPSPRDVQPLSAANTGFDTYTLKAPDGVEIKLKAPKSYNLRGARKGPKTLYLDLWGEALEPYLPNLAEAERAGLSESELIQERHGNEIQLELHAGLPDFLTDLKERSNFPRAVPRNFSKIYDLFYDLGYSNSGDRYRPGLYFTKNSDGRIVARPSPNFYYIPVDEERYPGTFLKCTGAAVDLKQPGICTAWREVTDHLFMQYRFPSAWLEHWDRFDGSLRDMIASFVGKDPGN